MTLQMGIALGITILMIVMIMSDKFAFGAPPLIACVLLVICGLATPQEAFAGFVNNNVIMIAGFMGIMAAFQKTSLIDKVKAVMLRLATTGGYKSYVLLVIIAMLAGSVFGAGATACYVLVLSLVSTLPYNKKLPPSKLLMPMGFATNQPLIPINVALHFGIMLEVLQGQGWNTNGITSVKFSMVNVVMNLGFLAWAIIGFKLLPDHEIAAASTDAKTAGASEALPQWKEYLTYACFVLGVLGMVFQSNLGAAGYVIPALATAILVAANVMSFKEAMSNIGAPVVLMMAGVVGVADALANTGFTAMVGEVLASALAGVSPFIIVLVFSLAASTLATFTGSNLGTAMVFAPVAVAACMALGFNPTAAAAAVVVSSWNGGYMPIDGMPAMIMGMGNYKLTEFWKFSLPMYFVRIIFLALGAVLVFPL